MTDERIVCADPEALAERGASWLVDTVLRMDAPVVRLALSGGSTPQRLYQRLAEPPHRDHMPWDRLAVFWGDERAVPADDEASNHRMAKEALLDRVSARAVHRIEAERPDAAARYHTLLNTMATEAWVVETTSPSPPTRRISLTLAAINAASAVGILVSGASKAERLAEVWAARDEPTATLPLARVRPTGRRVWLLDEEAAARLP